VYQIARKSKTHPICLANWARVKVLFELICPIPWDRVGDFEGDGTAAKKDPR
jgi:hypothetical protein